MHEINGPLLTKQFTVDFRAFLSDHLFYCSVLRGVLLRSRVVPFRVLVDAGFLLKVYTYNPSLPSVSRQWPADEKKGGIRFLGIGPGELVGLFFLPGDR